MPTTYTHDLFGRKVFQKLPEELRETVKECPMAYIIGLHDRISCFITGLFMKMR